MRKVIVIGGGASGMVAAITAAEDPECRVLLLERQARIGRKLLATGNGRCNLTNTAAASSDYNSGVPDFAEKILSAFSPRDTIDYFSSLGLVSVEQYGGRVFPLSDSASSVVDVLRCALESRHVEVITSCCVKSASKADDIFYVLSDDTRFTADSLIVACGGLAGGRLGGVPDGYDILRSFGHHCTKLHPALVPVTVDSEYPRSLKGIRAECLIRLRSGGRLLCSGKGELQFTEKGVSGPAVFDISREASLHGGELSIDFLYGLTEETVLSMLSSRRSMLPGSELQGIFVGMLHNRIGTVLAKYCSLRPSDPCSSLSGDDLRRLAHAAKDFRLRVKGTGDFDAAQITVGGIRTDEFSSTTLESLIVPGLYACGEVLDVDAPCGGYNLQWAWSSGRTAGRLMK